MDPALKIRSGDVLYCRQFLAAKGVGLVRSGTVLAGRYRLEQRIASGGMGEVWRAFDRVLGRVVAVKCLLTAKAEEPRFADRFWAEARTMATISHPGVVEVYDFGDDPAAGVYLVMKFIEGESLAHTLNRAGRLSAQATMRLVAEAAEALHAAHEMGVTHRDVKPGNLLLRPDGSAVLTDFGIASSVGVPGHTATGALVGTASYIAPERAHGHPATARSDIYSLGVVAYRCLAGHLPFVGESPVVVALRHVNDEPPPLPDDVPPRVRAVVERAMAKDPMSRWASGAVLAVEARRVLATPPAQPPGPPRREPTMPAAEPARLAAAEPARLPLPAAEAARLPLAAAEGARLPAVSGNRRVRRLLVLAGAALIVAIAGVMTASIVLKGHDDPQPQSLRQENEVSTQESSSPGAVNVLPNSGTANPTADPSVARPKPAGGATLPVAPKKLTATPLDPHTIRLQWTDDSANEDGFNISNALTSRNVAAGKTTYDWDGMPAAYYSCFKIRAYNSAGDSAYYPSAEPDWVCATTLPGVGPPAPSGLTAQAINAGTIRLRWTDTSADEEGFTINNAKTSRNVAAGTTTYDWTVTPGTYMCFMVRSYRWAGVSEYSQWACVTTPAT